MHILNTLHIILYTNHMPGPIQNAAGSMGEAVVKPVSDEVGKAIEEGVQALTGNYSAKPKTQDPNLNPQVQAQKQQSDMKKRNNIMAFINRFKTDKQALNQQRSMEQQKKQQEEMEEREKKMKVQQLEAVKSRGLEQNVAQQQAKTKSERKGGVGG